MPSYHCEACDMAIEPPICAKCGSPLIHRVIKVKDEDVAVAECPKGCGKIKSPTCCNKDMKAQK